MTTTTSGLTKKEAMALGIGALVAVILLLFMAHRMDQRERKLMGIATWQQCMLTGISDGLTGGRAVNRQQYDAIASDCRSN